MPSPGRRLRTPMQIALLASLALGCAKAPAPATETTSAAPAPQAAATATAVAANDGKCLASELAGAFATLDVWEGNPQLLDEAREKAKSVLKRDRDCAAAWVVLARCEYKAGYINNLNYEHEALSRAAKFVNHALGLDPELFEGHVTAAWIATFDTDYDLARQRLDEIAPERRSDPEVKAIELTIAQQEGDLASALKLARELSADASAPASARRRAFNSLASIYASQGMNDDADAAHRANIAAFPDSTWAHGNYAIFLLRRGDVDGAIAEGERAVKIQPYPLALNVLARSYAAKAETLWSQRRYDEAGGYIERIARLRGGESPEMHAAIGQFYERAGAELGRPEMLARAREAYEAALRMQDDFEPARKGLERLDRRRSG